jgi:hypothetical protein
VIRDMDTGEQEELDLASFIQWNGAKETTENEII